MILRLALALLPALAVACSAPRTLQPLPPVSPAASERYLEAWTLSRSADFRIGGPVHAEAVAHAAEAAALAPDWVAPQRFLDQWNHGPGLTLPDRYADHLAAAEGGSEARAYLAERLRPRGRRAPIGARAGQVDLQNPWSFHLEAWSFSQFGGFAEAVEPGRLALALSRDPSEVTLFAWTLSGYLDEAGRPDLGVGVLRGVLGAGGGRPDGEGLEERQLEERVDLAPRSAERAMLQVRLATLLLKTERREDLIAGAQLALELLPSPRITAAERESLLEALSEIRGQGLVSAAELELALARASATTQGGDREAAEALLERLRGGGAASRSRGAAAGSAIGAAPARSAGSSSGRRWRVELVRAFSSGAGESEPARTLEAWLGALPAPVRAGVARGGPVADLLGAVADLARDPAAAETLEEVGQRLVAAGWFREAVAWSDRLGEVDPEAARELRVAGLRGRAALGALLNLGRRLDARKAFSLASGAPESISSADDLHDEVARVLERSGVLPEGASGLESPVIGYGPAGSIVHPGPTFSAQDAELGRGREGAPVPGLAAAFARMGRFALVGRGAGQGGPDATVLRRLHTEVREGESLGRPFRGTVIWCQGADVPGRMSRRGGSIGGAALHEGYYVDLEVLAEDLRRWEDVADRFRAADGSIQRGAVARALAAPAPTTAPPTEVRPGLYAADRLRLALMAEAGGLDVPPLDRICEAVSAHEEAHLCDRARWYPLTPGRVLSVLGFAAGHGFSGVRISQALEERAQLVAMCVLEDPRFLWVDLLDAADAQPFREVSLHGAAYRSLLEALVLRLDADPRARETPGAGARWIDRLHLVDPAVLRAVALEEAEARGLVR